MIESMPKKVLNYYNDWKKEQYANLQQIPGLSGSSTQQLPVLLGSSISVPVQIQFPGLLVSSKQQPTANVKNCKGYNQYTIDQIDEVLYRLAMEYLLQGIGIGCKGLCQHRYHSSRHRQNHIHRDYFYHRKSHHLSIQG